MVLTVSKLTNLVTNFLLVKELPGDSRIAHLFFDLSVTTMYARCHDKQTGNHIFVTQQDYHCLQDNVKM